MRTGEKIIGGKKAKVPLLSKMTGELACCLLIEGQER